MIIGFFRYMLLKQPRYSCGENKKLYIKIMKVIQKIENKRFPLKWANLNNYPESHAYKKEIYLKNEDNISEELINLFFNLFHKYESNILIYNDSWWDFTIDTWDYNNEIYDYNLKNKSKETIDYLLMLSSSYINKGYSGICMCHDWKIFLETIMPCIISVKALYSPIFFNEKENFFFYFHHSGSIGFYYEKENENILDFIDIAEKKYLVE